VAVAAPIGPVNIMCIHRAVRRGFLAGLSAGIGAVFADGLFATIAAFGITVIAGFVEAHLGVVKLVGGIVLVLFGVVVALRRTPDDTEREDDDSRLGMVGAGVASFVLAVTNPGMLFGFLGIFGGLGNYTVSHHRFDNAAILVLGVMAGSLLWWVVLSAGVTRFRGKFRASWLHAFNLVAGGALALFGIAVLFDAAVDYLSIL
jgi:threonine/homoserine/homoserine lactone efflux protein